jgi:glutamate/tyrosine decarboxylase-like PLP-dependent enzyme
MGGGTPAGFLGQVLSSSMNANVFAGEQGAVHLEKQVLGWFRDLYDFPSVSSGILTDGCSMANLMALAVARHWATEGEVKSLGPEAVLGLRVYASDATHNSIAKAVELLGLGSEALRLLPSHEGRIDLQALEAAIVADRDAGLQPFCIVGNAGTVGIGAIDPLEALKAIAIKNGLWFHVDGAIGALGWLSPALRARLAGLPLCDSLAFDLHKWGQVPYDAGCLLVRNGRLHREAFASHAEYLAPSAGGITPPDAHAFNAYTPLLSRPDRAMKIWMTLQALGSERLAGVFEKNVAQAGYLCELVERHPELELMAPSALNIACFRYRGELVDSELDAVNEGIVVALQESGFCVLSPFRLHGRACLRVALSNHRTMRADIEALVQKVQRLGRKASAKLRLAS